MNRIFILLLLSACSGLQQSEEEKIRRQNATGEFIYRSHDDTVFSKEPLKGRQREKYPWENSPS